MQLATFGVDATDPAAVVTAAKSREPWVRRVAIRYLASIGQDVVPYLADPDFKLRFLTASLLADTGRREGHQVMAEDFEFFTRNGMARDAEAFRRARDEIVRDPQMLSQALEAGRVLARLGDFRARTLAEIAVAEAPQPAQRVDAVYVLENIVRVAREANQGAVGAMAGAMRNESERTVFWVLMGAMERTGGSEAIRILEAALEANGLQGIDRAAAESVLKKLRAQQPTTRPADARQEP